MPWDEIQLKSNGTIYQAGAPEYSDGEFQFNIRKVAESSLYFFSKAIIGRSYLTNTLHLPICDFIQKRPPFRKGLLMPRGHAKSSMVAHCLPPHILIQSPETNIYFPTLEGSDCRILLAGETQTMAERNLRVIQSIFESNPLFRALWPHRTFKNPSKESKKWNAQEMTIPRAVEYPDASIRAVGVGVAVTGSRPNVMIKDDLISVEARNSDVVMRRAIEWHVASRALFDEYPIESGLSSLEFIIGCLVGDSQVLMGNGTKRAIKDVLPGDVVWSTDTDKAYTKHKVVASISQGYALTWKLKTTAHEIRATGNHPFLVSSGLCELAWKKLEELKPGDYVVSHKEVPGVSVSRDDEFCWMFGFLLGDGWVSTRSKKGYVCCAAGVDEELNTRIVAAMHKYLNVPKIYLTKFGYYRVNSVEAASLLSSLGFNGSAKTKRIPEWCFKLSPKNKIALLKGFCDADGSWVSHKSWRVEISNKELLEDLQFLADTCGVRHGELATRGRLIHPPHSKEPRLFTSYGSNFNFASIGRSECSGSPNLYGGKNIGRDTRLNKGLRFERVVSVEATGIQEEVFDLTVEGTPSFFANGLAVHNTRWAVYDLYSYIEQEDPTVEWNKSFKSMISGGEMIWPEKFAVQTIKDHEGNVLKEGIEDLKKQFGSLFPLLYMNDASDPDLVDFDMSLVRQFELKNGMFIYSEDLRDTLLAKESNIGSPGLPEGATMSSQEVFSEFLKHGRGEYMRLRYA